MANYNTKQTRPESQQKIGKINGQNVCKDSYTSEQPKKILGKGKM